MQLPSSLQIPETEEALNDRFGILFFTIIFWSFNSMFIALTACECYCVEITQQNSSANVLEITQF